MTSEMEKYIIQLKTRFSWEDLKIFYDLELCKKMFFKFRILGLNVRLVKVVQI